MAAHTGIAGNERADELTKEGASAPPVGPEPSLCLSWSNVIIELLLKARHEMLDKLAKHKMNIIVPKLRLRAT